MAHASKGRHVTTTEQVYAQALLELAEQADVVKLIGEQLQDLIALAGQVPGFREMMISQVLNIQTKSEILDRVLKGKIHDLLYRFLSVVNRKGRLDRFAQIATAYIHLMEAKFGQKQVDIWVATPLSKPEQAAIAARLGEALKREVILLEHVDPALIGGLKVRVDDRLIDGTVVTQLKLMRDKMIAAGREKARLAMVE